MTQYLAVAESLGLEVVETFRLPPEAWWEYLVPLEKQCHARADDPFLSEIIATSLEEIDVYRSCGESYGYGFFVFRKP